MSLNDRIANEQIKNAQLLLQNDRISIASKTGEKNRVLTLKPIDEELLKEYNSQFPKSFEYTDPTTGDKKFRKYVPVGDAPVLEAPVLDRVYTEDELKQLYDKITKDTLTLMKLKTDFRGIRVENNKITTDVDNGVITPTEGQDLLDKQNDKRNNILKEINKYEREIRLARFLINNNPKVILENQKNISTTNQKNKGMVESYKDLLNTVNRGAFNTTQQSNETEEDYLLRLQRNAEIETPQENIEDMKLLTMKQFRTKLKEIIRNPVIIEQVANGIDTFGKVDNKLSLVKSWNLFKNKFVGIYGINNTKITADDIITFMNFFLNNEEVDDEIPEYIKQEITKPTTSISLSKLIVGQKNGDVYEITNNDTMKTLYLISVIGNDGELHLLHSFTGDKGSYREYFDDGIPPSKKKSSKEIEENTGITKDDIKKHFDITTQSLNPSIVAKKLKTMFGVEPIDTNFTTTPFETRKKAKKIEYGYGLHSENIPEHAQFGKIIILMKKLYYNNILAIKHHNGLSISGFPNIKVSDKFVSIIMNLLEGIYPTHVELNGLPMNEKVLFDRLIYLADLQKKVAHNGEKSVHELKKRLELLEGEKGAGNNSPLLKREVKKVLLGLKGFGVIKHKDMVEHLNQF
jgi:Txe/YoeB family toxin of Txe-Axe toxin-antitoxin module